MSLNVALQMDPVETIDISGDSSFALGLEAQNRGHRLFHYLVGDMSFVNDKVKAYARPLEFRREQGNHFTFDESRHMDIGDEIDVILMRQDPPFDMGYITATHILDHIHRQTIPV